MLVYLTGLLCVALVLNRQRSWTLDEVKKPLHVETGYIRVPNQKTVEMVIAQPTGKPFYNCGYK